MENFKSKYYNIEKFGNNWQTEELVPILSFLESVGIQTLQKIVTECGVSFTEGNENINNEEQLISVLFSDVSKDKLKEKLASYI